MTGPFPVPRDEAPQLEPVKVAGQIAAGITAVVGVLATLGVLTADAAGRVDTSVAVVVAAVPTVAGVVATLWAMWHARSQVTPVASPRADDGTPLVKAAALP
jgi:protein-S-isoprenylcysteine O-methyltransferase Ste14